MIPGDRVLLRIASSILLVLAVLGATGVAWTASFDLLLWDFVLTGALIAVGIAFGSTPVTAERARCAGCTS
jgi:hypothetical protein